MEVDIVVVGLSGIVAYIALDKNISVDKVDIKEIQKLLKKQEGIY